MYTQFLKDANPQKQINKLAKKYKNKKIIIYGAGQYARYVVKNYDLSKLNIIGFSDKSFIENENVKFYNYQVISPYNLKNTNFDIILILAWDDYQIYKYLNDEIQINTKKIDTILKPSFRLCLKYIINFDLL